MFPDCSGSNYVSFVPAYSFALAYFSSGDLYISACVLLSFLPFACQTAHLRFSRVACNLPLFPLACQVLPTLFSIFFSLPSLRSPARRHSHRCPRMQPENTSQPAQKPYSLRHRAFARHIDAAAQAICTANNERVNKITFRKFINY